MVITLDRRKKPLGHCTERRARKLIEAGRACVYRYYPFTIIVKDRDIREMGTLPGYRIKIDPGSRLMNLTGCSFEAVRFDTQLMENPDISGTEYQHGTGAPERPSL